jgi:hypothetical protein
MDLKVTSTATVGNHIMDALNPKITFKSGGTTKYVIRHDNTLDKLEIDETGVGNVIEIENGALCLPQYTTTINKNLHVEANGKVVAETKKLLSFNKYNFSLIEKR